MLTINGLLSNSYKDLRKVQPSFKSVPPQLYFDIAGLASTKKWREIQNKVEEERFQSRLSPY